MHHEEMEEEWLREQWKYLQEDHLWVLAQGLWNHVV